MCGCMMLCCLLAVEYAQTQIKTQTQKQKHNHKSVANGPSIDGLKVERQINAYTGAFEREKRQTSRRISLSDSTETLENICLNTEIFLASMIPKAAIHEIPTTNVSILFFHMCVFLILCICVCVYVYACVCHDRPHT